MDEIFLACKMVLHPGALLKLKAESYTPCTSSQVANEGASGEVLHD